MLMVTIKMKRKSVLDHHFCDFPLSSPATKIRRLQPQQEQPELCTSEPPSNDERALVLYKPPPSSFTVDSDILSAIRDEVRRLTQSDPIISAEQNDHLAVVPWVPPQSPHVSDTDASEVMDMEVEEEDSNRNSNSNNVSSTHQSAEGGNVMKGGEELLQWQQQHCLVPQLPRITATPITWT